MHEYIQSVKNLLPRILSNGLESKNLQVCVVCSDRLADSLGRAIVDQVELILESKKAWVLCLWEFRISHERGDFFTVSKQYFEGNSYDDVHLIIFEDGSMPHAVIASRILRASSLMNVKKISVLTSRYSPDLLDSICNDLIPSISSLISFYEVLGNPFQSESIEVSEILNGSKAEVRRRSWVPDFIRVRRMLNFPAQLITKD